MQYKVSYFSKFSNAMAKLARLKHSHQPHISLKVILVIWFRNFTFTTLPKVLFTDNYINFNICFKNPTTTVSGDVSHGLNESQWTTVIHSTHEKHHGPN